MNQIEKMNMCAIWLIKHLCIETNATTASLEQDITYEGKKLGRYRVTIEEL